MPVTSMLHQSSYFIFIQTCLYTLGSLMLASYFLHSSLNFYWQILDTPSLLAEGSAGVKKNIFKQKPPESDATSTCC